MLEPGLAESLFDALRKSAAHIQEQGMAAVLVVSPSIRPWLARMARHRVSDIVVLSYSEIPDDHAVKIVYTVDTELKQ
jgi:flagellar biosynthesis protein FlhA